MGPSFRKQSTVWLGGSEPLSQQPPAFLLLLSPWGGWSDLRELL